MTYQACREAAAEVGAALSLSQEIEIQTSACEGNDVAFQSCYLGCSLGALSGAPATYSYLTATKAAEFGAYNNHRCISAPHEYCLCADSPPPPPPPPTMSEETEWTYAGTGVAVGTAGHSTAFFKHVADDVSLPSEFRSHRTGYECAGDDSGAAVCARHCADKVGASLVAFTVRGVHAPPPMPDPPLPPSPPTPPPTPRPPRVGRFHGATEGCALYGVYIGPQCRDGGVGSIYPPLCPYGSQV